MRTTLTLLGNRVAQSFDYKDGMTHKGENIRVGPTRIGGIPLCVEFDPESGRILSILNMHRNAPPTPSEIGPQAIDAIRAQCAKDAAKARI